MGPRIRYNASHRALEEALDSIARSGDYFAEGRLQAEPPRLAVDSVGTIAFPVPDSQVRSLIETAKRAPYGRGEETIVDTSVRDCWQIDDGSLRFEGARWQETLSSIVQCAAEGLGLPTDRVSARIYKLLIYEGGGFFADHRDTEKADGMVATLVISLPVEGEGGDLVIRHKDRETAIAMCVQDPGELAFAAFYADCVHQTKPVTTGHRISLIYNLVVEAGGGPVPANAPVTSSHAERCRRVLADWVASEGSPKKLVWLLEHAYSPDGLGFETLKGTDAAAIRTLRQAAEASGCTLHLAILRIIEEGNPDYSNAVLDPWEGGFAEWTPIGEVLWGTYVLENWIASDGTDEIDLPEIPLLDGEALPAGALDDVEPDGQTKAEATGNEGATFERSYRRAAAVVWPESRAVPAIAVGGIVGAVRYIAGKWTEGARSGCERERAIRTVAQLLDAWPEADSDSESASAVKERGDAIRTTMGLLVRLADEEQTARFLDSVLARNYRKELNDMVALAVESVTVSTLARFVPALVLRNATAHLGGLLQLLLQLGERPDGRDAGDTHDILRAGARSALEALPQVLADPIRDGFDRWAPKPAPVKAEVIRDMFLAAQRFDLPAAMDEAAALLEHHPRAADPCRALPRALRALRRQAKALSDAPALASLWLHAASSLLARSATPPPGEEDLSIEAPFECDCADCAAVKAFCRDPSASVLRHPANKADRRHIQEEIRHAKIALGCGTEKVGRPYKLVCRKTPAGYRSRMRKYAADIQSMKWLVGAAPASDAKEIAATLESLRSAVSDAQ